MSGHVALVGAGPGDPDLLTVRGLRCIEQAEVIIHDRLGTERLVGRAPADCELIDVGKAPGRHCHSQSEINALMIAHATAGRRVVRLKGGDPFVFGRGGEEALALATAGIDFEVVPGISTAIAAPAAAGIPVTHRALSRTLTIASGHDDPALPEVAARWRTVGATDGTLVLMMSMTHLDGITRALVDGGRSPDEPAAAIHWATTERQQTVFATLGTIEAACRAAGVGNPSVVVIGNVVGLAEDIAASMLASSPTPT